MNYIDLSKLYTPPFDEDIDIEDVEKIIDLLNILNKYGCDDEYTVEEVIEKALDLLAREEDGSFSLDCKGVRIVVEKKTGLFNIYEEE